LSQIKAEAANSAPSIDALHICVLIARDIADVRPLLV
jgi:hypothetical protein